MNTTSRDDVCNQETHGFNAHSHFTRENAARKRLHRRAVELSCARWFAKLAKATESRLP